MLLSSLRCALRRVAAPRTLVALGGGGVALVGCGIGSSALCDAPKEKLADKPKKAGSTFELVPTFEFRCLAELIGTAILVQGAD